MAFMMVGDHRSTKDYKHRVETRECDYRLLYRFEIENVRWLEDHFLGESSETRGGALSSFQKMKTFPRYMSDPGFQSGVGEDIGIDQTTVSRTVHFVKQKILEKADLWIKFPTTIPEIQVAKTKWANKFRIPTAIGAIDCTHIRILKPKEDGDEYVCRKGYPSLNVQATCNSDECFTSLSAEWPGSVHDSRILRNSSVFQAMTSSQDTILLGDSGYGISPWLMTPYDNPQTPIQQNYNNVYAKERVIIERCFGQLKRRFPILQYKVRTALHTIPSIITCCVVLHNVAKYLKDSDDFPTSDPDDDLPPAEQVEMQNIGNPQQIRQLGQQKRNHIPQILFEL